VREVSVSCEECEAGKQAATEVATSRPLCHKPGDLGGKRHWCEMFHPHIDGHVSYCGRQWLGRGALGAR